MKSRLLCVFLMLCAPAFCDSISTSEAVIDWSGLAFTTTGTLHLDSIPFFFGFSDSLARTSGSITDHKTTTDSPAAWLTTGATSTTTWPLGTASAIATTNNGLLHSSALVTTTDSSFFSSLATAQTAISLTFVGTGTGTLIIQAPYTLTLDCTPDSPVTTARVELSAGVLSADTLTCAGAPITKSGTLTASRDLVNPTRGVSFTMRGAALAYAQTTVPEPATIGMLALGIPVMFWFAYRSRK